MMDGGPSRRLLRRFSSIATFTASIPLSGIGVPAIGAQVILPKIDPTQALRIIAGSALVEDASSTGKLTVLGSNAGLYTLTGTLLRMYSPGMATVIVGAAGVRWGWIDDEYIFGNDYLEVIGTDPAGQFKVVVGADVSNSDGAAAHTITEQLTLLVELYQLAIDRGQPSSDVIGAGGPLDWVRRPGT
jgi:hypothetical protein